MIRLLSYCPPPETLAQAASEGVPPALQQHLRTCERCQMALEEERDAQSLFKNFPRRAPSPTEHENAKQALLAAAAQPAKTRRIWPLLVGLAAVFVLATSAALFFGSEPPGKAAPSPERRGVVYAGDGARFLQDRKKGDEVVRLTEGTITVEVEHLQPGERFRVVTGDAEVEVRGTAFEVVVHNDRLVSVKVIRGAVDVRPKEKPTVRLSPGQKWETPEAASLPTSEPTPASEPASIPTSEPVSLPTTMLAASTPVLKAPAPVLKAPAPKTNSEEEIFQSALAAMRAGNLEEAEKGFAEVAASQNSGFAEDASYWLARTLNRSGSPRAQAACEDFITRYPGNPKVYDIRLALAQLFLKQKKEAEARIQLEEVTKSAPEVLKRRAQEVLDALDKKSPASQPALP